MQPARPEKDNDRYTAQFIFCLLLVLCITISMAIYISRLNVWIDKTRLDSATQPLECGKGQGAFIIDPSGKRNNCYFVEDAEAADDQ
ncbi:hypothetical protein [Pseudomonas brassicacearum]|uniref:Uncharacterized protein n=1 Tax=Pseudomonas brassicacearum TaxID=930166 RepID=A0A423GRY2_9PSED|nr:hypothetical protein [Pseudomonas brassicacearum]ROM97221.1 hypothetical protein BK658_13395 [Pseudomonas brassicacearum]